MPEGVLLTEQKPEDGQFTPSEAAAAEWKNGGGTGQVGQCNQGFTASDCSWTCSWKCQRRRCPSLEFLPANCPLGEMPNTFPQKRRLQDGELVKHDCHANQRPPRGQVRSSGCSTAASVWGPGRRDPARAVKPSHTSWLGSSAMTPDALHEPPRCLRVAATWGYTNGWPRETHVLLQTKPERWPTRSDPVLT